MKINIKHISKNTGSKRLMIIGSIILVITILFYKLNSDLRPVLIAYCDYEARTLAMCTINKTILNEFENNVTYDDLITVKNDNEGKIVMIQANTIELNKLAAEITLNVQDNIKQASRSGVDTHVPLGVVLKNDMFAYMGPKIRFRMEPAGTAYTSYRSEFQAAGINQTRHIIYLDVTIDIYVIIPLYRNSITVASAVPIAESIIIGDVPNSYTDIQGLPYYSVPTPTPTP